MHIDLNTDTDNYDNSRKPLYENLLVSFILALTLYSISTSDQSRNSRHDIFANPVQERAN